MVKLTCLNSVTEWKTRQISAYPEIAFFIERLEKKICEEPDAGMYEPILSKKDVLLPCRRKDINIRLFSNHYAIGYSYISANYLYNNESAIIVRMNYK